MGREWDARSSTRKGSRREWDERSGKPKTKSRDKEGKPSSTDSSGGGSGTRVTKASNESVSSSTTLQNDNELTFNIAASGAYRFSGVIIASSASGTPDMHCSFTVPTNASLLWFFTAGSSSVSTTSGGGTVSNTTGGAININSAEDTIIHVEGLVVAAGTGGAVTFVWAQNTSNGTATTVEAGSFLAYSKF